MRAKAAREMGKTVWNRVAANLVGSRQRVLVESAKDSTSVGNQWITARAANYFPVKIDPKSGPVNQWVNVRIIEIEQEFLLARR